MRERPILFSGPMVRAVFDGRKTQTRRLGAEDPDRRCPYGEPGDRLWVRERHARHGADPLVPVHYFADGDMPTISERHDAGLLRAYPSILMPRWACRLVLEVTAVRVERLQGISEVDARAEGIQKWPLGYRVEVSGAPKYESLNFDSAAAAYRNLWDYINAKRSPWASNPWVWVVEFRTVAGAARRPSE